MVEIEPTELVLLVAKRRRQGRRTLGRMASPPANVHTTFVKGICFALLITNTLLYVVKFGPIGALGWGAVAYIVSRAPVD